MDIFIGVISEYKTYEIQLELNDGISEEEVEEALLRCAKESREYSDSQVEVITWKEV